MSDNGDVPQAIVARMMREGVPQEEILVQLRADGYSILDSIKALTVGAGLSLADAKQAVHLSRAWADRREQNEAFHEHLSKTSDSEKNSN